MGRVSEASNSRLEAEGAEAEGDEETLIAWKLATIRAEPDMTAFATAPMQIASAVKVERGDGGRDAVRLSKLGSTICRKAGKKR